MNLPMEILFPCHLRSVMLEIVESYNKCLEPANTHKIIKTNAWLTYYTILTDQLTLSLLRTSELEAEHALQVRMK